MEVPARAGPRISAVIARSINPCGFDRTGPRGRVPFVKRRFTLVAEHRAETKHRLRESASTCRAPFSSSTTIRFSGGFSRRCCAASATSRSWPRAARRGCRSCARPTAARIDVVILDLVMPNLDGIGVLAKLRESGDRDAGHRPDRARLDRDRGAGDARRRDRLRRQAGRRRAPAGLDQERAAARRARGRDPPHAPARLRHARASATSPPRART